MELIPETRNPATFTKPWGWTSPKPWLTLRGLFFFVLHMSILQAPSFCCTMQQLGRYHRPHLAPLELVLGLEPSERSERAGFEANLNTWNNYSLVFWEVKSASCQALDPCHAAARAGWHLGVQLSLCYGTKLWMVRQKPGNAPLPSGNVPKCIEKMFSCKVAGNRRDVHKGWNSLRILICGTKPHRKKC